MKKLLTGFVVFAMLIGLFGVATSAESYMEKEPMVCEYEVTVLKADPAAVKKDGIIDVAGGEYIKADVPFSELSVNFGDSSTYSDADAMAHTMEYYFSWDDTNGFNFAVKYFAKGEYNGVSYDGYYTNIPAGTDAETPGDDFLCNVGLNFSTGKHKEVEGWSLLYYAIGRYIDDPNGYLTGHYNQLGNSGTYSATGGKDFVVNYPGDGSVIFEWSVPFNEFIDVAPTDGVSFGFTLSACAGDVTPETIYTDNYTVSLGQCGFGCASSKDNRNATAILSTAPIKENETSSITAPPDIETTANGETNVAVDNTVTPTQAVATRIETSVVTETVVVTNSAGEAVTNEKGENVTEIITEIVSNVVTDEQQTQAPMTGDPTVIASIVAMISACGVVVAKKKNN